MKFKIEEDYKLLKQIYDKTKGRVPVADISKLGLQVDDFDYLCNYDYMYTSNTRLFGLMYYFKKRTYMHFFKAVDMTEPKELVIEQRNGKKIPEDVKDKVFDECLDIINIMYQFSGICFVGLLEEFIQRLGIEDKIDRLLDKALIKIVSSTAYTNMQCYVLAKGSITRLFSKHNAEDTKSIKTNPTREQLSYLKMKYLLSEEDPAKYLSPTICNSNILSKGDLVHAYPKLIAQYMKKQDMLLLDLRRRLVRIQLRDNAMHQLKLARLRKDAATIEKCIAEVKRLDSRAIDEDFCIEPEHNFNNISTRNIYIQSLTAQKTSNFKNINVKMVNFLAEQRGSLESVVRAIIDNYKIAHNAIGSLFLSSGVSRDAQGEIIAYTVNKEYVVVVKTGDVDTIRKELKIRDLDLNIQVVGF